jgi:hypothetical protein
MDMRAVFDGLRAHLALLDDIEVDVMIGSAFLQQGIETLPRPPEQLAQPMDGDSVVVGAEAIGGSLELPP